MAGSNDTQDTGDIRNWRSIVTLIVFVITSKFIRTFSFGLPATGTLMLWHRYYCAVSIPHPHPDNSSSPKWTVGSSIEMSDHSWSTTRRSCEALAISDELFNGTTDR